MQFISRDTLLAFTQTWEYVSRLSVIVWSKRITPVHHYPHCSCWISSVRVSGN
jgi:hypothetical protein